MPAGRNLEGSVLGCINEKKAPVVKDIVQNSTGSRCSCIRKLGVGFRVDFRAARLTGAGFMIKSNNITFRKESEREKEKNLMCPYKGENARELRKRKIKKL